MDDQINRFRERIDEIDAQVLQLISERANCAHRIGELKGGAVVYRPEREAQVLRRLREINTGPLPGDSVQHLFTEIISACRALERDMRVAYLGPRGTYSEEAVAKKFGAQAEGEPCASIAEVFQRVEAADLNSERAQVVEQVLTNPDGSIRAFRVSEMNIGKMVEPSCHITENFGKVTMRNDPFERILRAWRPAPKT